MLLETVDDVDTLVAKTDDRCPGCAVKVLMLVRAVWSLVD